MCRLFFARGGRLSVALIGVWGFRPALAGTGPTTPITSRFDAGLEGWTSNPPADVFWAATGGNPGGYTRFVDEPTNATSIIAPASYLGDWSALNDVGEILFDHRIFVAGGFDVISPYIVALSGPGGSARWFGPTPTGTTPWTTLMAPVVQSAWTVESGTWSGLLNNVTQFSIRIELVQNTGGAVETAGIDNVILTPEPAGVALFGLGAMFVFRRDRYAR